MMSGRKAREQRALIAGQTAQGFVEVLVAFGVLLDSKGVCSRSELARTFRLLIDQQHRTIRAEGLSAAEADARTCMAIALREFFDLPAGPSIIEGGKSQE